MVMLRKLSMATLMTDATIDALFVISRHTPANIIPRRDSLRDHNSSNSSSSGFALALALIVAIALALALALIVAFTALAVAFAAAL